MHLAEKESLYIQGVIQFAVSSSLLWLVVVQVSPVAFNEL